MNACCIRDRIDSMRFLHTFMKWGSVAFLIPLALYRDPVRGPLVSFLCICGLVNCALAVVYSARRLRELRGALAMAEVRESVPYVVVRNPPKAINTEPQP